jgi:hypothetical protein
MKKPAFKRFTLLNKIQNYLKNNKVSDCFLSTNGGGCSILALWLNKLPDDSYPNPKIVSCILDIVERMNINPSE